MVAREFAVLFKRHKLSETSEEFIPYKVIEGIYQDNDNWFMDLDEVVYPHIAEPMLSGIGYAYRRIVSQEVFTEQDIIDIKKDMMDLASASVYMRDRKDSYFIKMRAILDEPDNTFIFEDDDTLRLYRQYDKNGSVIEEDMDEEHHFEVTLKPCDIKDNVIKTIKGQDSAIEKIITAIWMTYNIKSVTKKNMLVIGPTGVGKTAIFEKLSKILDIPLTIFAVPGLSQAGYEGRSVDEILKQVYLDNDKNINKAENSIIILDEIDKLAYGKNNTGDISTSGVQNELLKIIEGCKRVVTISEYEGTSFTIDTHNMLFVGTGAFQELYDRQPCVLVTLFR